MEITHRINSSERQHYLLEKHYSFKLKPQLIYVGSLDKQGGWREELHSHNFLEIIFIVDGSGKVTIGNSEEYNIRKGDIVIYNAGIPHCEKSSAEDPMEARFIAFDKLEMTDLPPNWLLPPDYSQIYHTGDMYRTFLKYFTGLIEETEQKKRLYVEISQNMSKTLLMYLFRLINRTEKTVSLFESGKLLESAVGYINDHYKENITLEDISRSCNINKYYLSHVFSQAYGESIGKYIKQFRLNKACEMLQNTKMSVREIAESIGVLDISYFCRVFKKEKGMTPLEYRASRNSK